MAARVAKESFLRSLTSPEGLHGVRSHPRETLSRAFADAHLAIEAAFRKWYEDAGWSVSKGAGKEGYLTRTKPGAAPQCVHGGTTATVVVLLDGQRLVISNVGDSTALLCGVGEAGQLRSIDEWQPVQAVVNGAAARGGGEGGGAGSRAGDTPASGSATPIPPALLCSFMELSADHSPESASEFGRMHRFRPHASLPHHPELMFVYDTLTASKTACPPIFDVDTASGTCARTDRGNYYKNVRCEWASLVSTPLHAPYQDALAFTRSLGDLHLQMYGVTHAPEIWWIDLAVPASAGGGVAGLGEGRRGGGGDAMEIAEELASKLALSGSQMSDAGGGGPVHGAPIVVHPIAVVLCSDGVWDNWKFQDVSSFVLDKARVDAVHRSGTSDAAAGDLMAANLDRARVNFGSSADNMTAISESRVPTCRVHTRRRGGTWRTSLTAPVSPPPAFRSPLPPPPCLTRARVKL